MNNGKTYDIRHPEFIEIGRDSVVCHSSDQPDGPDRQFDTASLLLISHIEFLAMPSQSVPGNGAPSV